MPSTQTEKKKHNFHICSFILQFKKVEVNLTGLRSMANFVLLKDRAFYVILANVIIPFQGRCQEFQRGGGGQKREAKGLKAALSPQRAGGSRGGCVSIIRRLNSQTLLQNMEKKMKTKQDYVV